MNFYSLRRGDIVAFTKDVDDYGGNKIISAGEVYYVHRKSGYSCRVTKISENYDMARSNTEATAWVPWAKYENSAFVEDIIKIPKKDAKKLFGNIDDLSSCSFFPGKAEVPAKSPKASKYKSIKSSDFKAMKKLLQEN
jgi:hypothetical protein